MRTHGTTTSTSDDSFRRVEVITGVGRRRRWTDEEKAWIVAESLDPATTTSAVARRYGLHPSQLFVWRQRLAAPAAREAPGFVPVVIVDDASFTPNANVSPVSDWLLVPIPDVDPDVVYRRFTLGGLQVLVPASQLVIGGVTKQPDDDVGFTIDSTTRVQVLP